MIIKTLKSMLGTNSLLCEAIFSGHTHKRNSQKGYAKGYNDIHGIKGHLCTRLRFDFWVVIARSFLLDGVLYGNAVIVQDLREIP